MPVVALLLSSCASDSATVRLPVAELVGIYHYGDGIGPGETLTLNRDGTFNSSIGGDLINTPIGLSGTWSLDGEKVTFIESGLAPGQKPFHTFALTQTYKGQLVLIPGEDAKRRSISHSFVYRKQSE